MLKEEMVSQESTLKNDIKVTAGKLIKTIFVLCSIGYLNVVITSYIIANNGESFGLIAGVDQFLKSSLPIIITNLLVIIMSMKITKLKIKSDIFCENESNAKFIALSSTFVVGVSMIGGIVTGIFMSILQSKGITPLSPNFDFSKNAILGLILNLGYVCVLAPIFEEIIFRGFILKSMEKYGNLIAIIVSSLLFSMYHLNLAQLIPTMLIGIVLSIITIKSKSIVPAIIAHIFNNIVSSMMRFVGSTSSQVVSLIVVGIVLVIILGSILFIKIYRKEISKMIKENSKILKTHQKIAASFSGGWAIAYIVFWVIVISTGIFG